MEEEKRKAYSEVVEILKLIEDEEKIEKIPFEVVELIKRNSDPTYKPQISKEIPLEEQNLKEETYVILGWIANKYWGEDIAEIENKEKIEEKESQEVQGIQEIKTLEEERTIRNAAVYNDIDPEILEREVLTETNNLPALITEMNWYQKIKAKVLKIFKFIFRINKKSIEKEEVNE